MAQTLAITPTFLAWEVRTLQALLLAWISVNPLEKRETEKYEKDRIKKKKKRQNDILSHHFLTCPDCLCPSSCPSCSSPGAEKTSETSWLFRCYLFFRRHAALIGFAKCFFPKILTRTLSLQSIFEPTILWNGQGLKDDQQSTALGRYCTICTVCFLQPFNRKGTMP